MKSSIIMALAISVLTIGCGNPAQTSAVRVQMNYCQDQSKPECSEGITGFEYWMDMYFNPNIHDTPNLDTFCQVTLVKRGAFNAMDVWLATDADFKSSVYSSGYRIAGVISNTRMTVGIGCLYSGTRLYAKICRHDAGVLVPSFAPSLSAAGTCTQVYAFTLPDNSQTTKLDSLGYRTPEVEIVAEHLSAMKAAIGGLQLAYSCQEKSLTATNTATEKIFYTIDDPSNNGAKYVSNKSLDVSGVETFQTTLPEDAGIRVQVWASSWVGGAADQVSKKPASSTGYLKMSCAGDMEITSSSNISETAMTLPAVMGVTSKLYAGQTDSNGNQTTQDIIEAFNGSSTNACFQLRKLEDLGNGKYGWGFDNGNQCIKSGKTEIVSNIDIPIDSGAYAIVVRDYMFMNNWSPARVKAFTLTKTFANNAIVWSQTDVTSGTLPNTAPPQ